MLPSKELNSTQLQLLGKKVYSSLENRKESHTFYPLPDASPKAGYVLPPKPVRGDIVGVPRSGEDTKYTFGVILHTIGKDEDEAYAIQISPEGGVKAVYLTNLAVFWQ